ncbi:MAG: ATP-dependent 6-phosphofructokinase [Gemmatimonadota bacterium]|jgi:phosphofructokinase-like protein
MRIAINTGGGDAPGLNAVIRAVVLAADQRGWEVYGIRKGYNGILGDEEDGIVRLDRRSVRGITHQGGTIIGTTNRGDPLAWPLRHPDGTVEKIDRGYELVDAFRERNFDCLIAVGGDGSLRIAAELHRRGLKVVGVPKTIDNDLAATSVTFGFHTAVQTASDAIGKLHSTAEAHRRVMVVEVMGRDAGWIALFAGLAGTADVILIPEIPYRLSKVCEKVESRFDDDDGFAIVVVAEGARPEEGDPVFEEENPETGMPRYGGIAERLAEQIAASTGRESRSLVLGHLQRGGEPVAYDKILALRFGAAAVDLVEDGRFGCMVALDPPDVLAVPLEQATARMRLVPVDSDVVLTARSLGVSFGD